MKILVFTLKNGVFKAINANDREEVIEVIKSIDNGHYYAEISKEYGIQLSSKLLHSCCKIWNEMVSYYLHDGIVQMIEVSENEHASCKCVGKFTNI